MNDKLNALEIDRITDHLRYGRMFQQRGPSGVVVSTLGFRSEGRWFDAQSLPLCCFLRQETLPHIVSLQPGV